MEFELGLTNDAGLPPEAGGRVHNEDNYLVAAGGVARWRDPDQGPQSAEVVCEGVLAAVCDGMGGHERGDLASARAAECLRNFLRPGQPERPAEALRSHLLKAHRELHQEAVQLGLAGMGTTLTAAWVLGRSLHWVQIGDSRLYLHREGQLTQLTEDQTTNLYRLRDGLPPEEPSEALAQAFIFGSRGLGDDQNLRIELDRDTGTVELQSGDRLLLATDGAYRVLVSEDLQDLMCMGLSAQDTSNAIVAQALSEGTTDNATVLVVDILKLPARARRSSAWQDDEDTLIF